MKRPSLAAAAKVSLSLVALISTNGCLQGAALENKDEFLQVRGCDMESLVEKRCGTSACHDGQGGTPGGGIDLFLQGSPTVPPVYLVNALPYIYGPSYCPSNPNRVVIDPVNLNESWLLMKLYDQQGPGCGVLMPYNKPALPASEISCFETWVQDAVNSYNAAGGTP